VPFSLPELKDKDCPEVSTVIAWLDVAIKVDDAVIAIIRNTNRFLNL
jgi:hypothetical protein